ncbi:unnamed protein product [Trifolium pratense]|uniref:Uncharacterized protein n=1 Tax=Trifolium pratense TaxID=57577 RepID=A0ACB0LI75_TRIPR|nr:unnamed protein product [Trifolium pratense]
MTKSLKFVSALILFLTLFLTTMTVYNNANYIPTSTRYPNKIVSFELPDVHKECETDIDCYIIYRAKKLLNGYFSCLGVSPVLLLIAGFWCLWLVVIFIYFLFSTFGTYFR